MENLRTTNLVRLSLSFRALTVQDTALDNKETVSCAERQARQDLNPQPAVLETAALPIELLAYGSPFRIAYLVSRCKR